MLKVKDIIGKPVIAADSGESIEMVVAPIFDFPKGRLRQRDENYLLGFLVDPDGWLSNPKVLPLYLVKAIRQSRRYTNEADAVIIPWKESIAPASDYATIQDVLEQNNSLNIDRILMNNERDLSTLFDLYFNENTDNV